MAFLVAIAVNERGVREILGCDVGAAETGAVWSGVLRSLVARGLSGVVLVTSDAHVGLVETIRLTLLGASWQRSSVHTGPGARGPVSPRAEGALAAMTV